MPRDEFVHDLWLYFKVSKIKIDYGLYAVYVLRAVSFLPFFGRKVWANSYGCRTDIIRKSCNQLSRGPTDIVQSSFDICAEEFMYINSYGDHTEATRR